MLVREFTTRNWCCFFTWKLPLPPCIEPGITLYCPSFMHFAHPTVHLPKHMHLCSNSSKQWHMLLMCKKKPWHLEKREMHGIPQCVWTVCSWFCSDTIRSRCWPFWLFKLNIQSLMDQLPPDLFQGQNLCHIHHTFKTGILQNLFGYILQIWQGHTTFC